MPDRDDNTASGSGPGGSGSDLTGLAAAVATAADLALKIGAALLIGSICYLVYGLLNVPDGVRLSDADRARTLGNFGLGLRGLVWGGALVALSVTYRLFSEEAVGYLFAILGVAGVWATPFVMTRFIPAGLPGLLELFNKAGLRLGGLLLALGTIIVAADLIWRATESWAGRRKMGTVGLPGQEKFEKVLGSYPWRCWQTSYCRPVARAVCPRHDERTPCWRVKEGCFCEERVVLRALDKNQEGGRKLLSQMQNKLHSSAPGMTMSGSQKRQRCRRCPIYAEHQRFKYRILMPFVFPVTAAIAVAASAHVRKLLEVWVPKADQLAARFSFGFAQKVSAAGEAAGSRAYSDFDIQMIYIGVMLFLAIMILTWLLRLVEYLSFKVQI